MLVRNLLGLLILPLAIICQDELEWAVKEQEAHPYVVPVISADEFPDWLKSDPDLAKFVLFTVDERWCHLCRRIVCPFNEVASNILENTADFCKDELETYESRFNHRIHLNHCLQQYEEPKSLSYMKTYGGVDHTSHCGYNYSVFMPYFGFFDLSNYPGSLADIDTSTGFVKFAIVKVNAEFMKLFKIPGIPHMRLYKANGEMIDYIGTKMFRRPYLAILLRVFLGVNLWNEPINQPCINFQAIGNGPSEDSWVWAPEGKVFPGSWGHYCSHMKDQQIKARLSHERRRARTEKNVGNNRFISRQGMHGIDNSIIAEVNTQLFEQGHYLNAEFYAQRYEKKFPHPFLFLTPSVQYYFGEDGEEIPKMEIGNIVPNSYVDFDYVTAMEWAGTPPEEKEDFLWYQSLFGMTDLLTWPTPDKKDFRNVDFEYLKAEIESWDPDQFT